MTLFEFERTVSNILNEVINDQNSEGPTVERLDELIRQTPFYSELNEALKETDPVASQVPDDVANVLTAVKEKLGLH